MVHRPRQVRGRVAVATLVLHLVLVLVPQGTVLASPAAWEPPLDAEVVDSFRPPSRPWAAGNRGLAYAARPGEPVRAVDAGVVSFVGRIASDHYVTVDHGAGLRSTYAYVSDPAVVRGQRVDQGQPLAAATAGFHLTARLADRYVDPALLLAGADPVPRLRPGALPNRGGAVWSPARSPARWSFDGFLDPPRSGRHAMRAPGLGGVRRWLSDRTEDLAQFGGSISRSAEALVQEAARSAWLGAQIASPALATLDEAVGSAAEVVRRLAQEDLTSVRGAASALGRAVGAVALEQLDVRLALLRQLFELLPAYSGWVIARSVSSWHHDGDCTSDDVALAPPAAGRVLIQVGGLGTSDRGASVAKLDPGSVGYDERDVVAFSYRGGCTPVPFGFDAVPSGSIVAQLPTGGYAASDTYQDLRVSATRLADLIDQVHAARPGAPIDVAAHSLGGAVTRLALEILAERHGGAPPVSVVITVGSPHQGAELAGAAVALPLIPMVDAGLTTLAPGRAAEARAESVHQLARGTLRAIGDPDPPPEGVRVVSIAGAGDVVVPADNTYWAGAHNTVAGPLHAVGLDVHGDLPARREVARELALAVAGLPGRCIGFATALGAAVIGRGIGRFETGASLALALMPL